ncbi:L-dopachrome tautomerase-related protein [Muricauda brasiliensis]|uniref:L-dopachrome tautomerase-related protein n=1 Tax=Muricauda brasiliensis TaxID=2162892 RepID=UPI000D37328E|nr:L-dopachrome tautomerase-related protein [Muricauda brasiliensis]
MKTIGHIILLTLTLAVMACKDTTRANRDTVGTNTAPESQKLETVFTDSIYQFTGVAVANDDRLFVNYPYWLDTHQYSVVEVKQGKAVPYPNETWNSFKKGEDGQNKFVCVQAVYTDDQNYLWIVDAAGIGLGPVYQRSNKVIKINLATDAIERIYRFPEEIINEHVYLNDIRVDNQNGFAYMTDSSSGGLVVLDINSGESRYVLEKSPAVLSDKNYTFSPLGEELTTSDGNPLKVNSDGIALSPDREWLYFKPLTDAKLYRINTSVLMDFETPKNTIEESVIDLGTFTTTDGMIFDDKGNLYFGDLEQHSILKITPDLQMQELVQDKDQLIWPDSYSISKDGYLYITASQIQWMPWFHQGKNKTKIPYKVLRLKL